MTQPIHARIHPSANVQSIAIGAGTQIWQYVVVLPGATIGKDCSICDGVFIETEVFLGDRVTVKCGVHLWDGIRLEDEVFVGPNGTFTKDRFPRRTHYSAQFLTTTVKEGASTGGAGGDFVWTDDGGGGLARRRRCRHALAAGRFHRHWQPGKDHRSIGGFS